MDPVHVPHYHIRWSGKAMLDWERFSTQAEAEASARELMRLGENYTIDKLDGDCTRCLDLK
jgi:hypothetical protein